MTTPGISQAPLAAMGAMGCSSAAGPTSQAAVPLFDGGGTAGAASSACAGTAAAGSSMPPLSTLRAGRAEIRWGLPSLAMRDLVLRPPASTMFVSPLVPSISFSAVDDGRRARDGTTVLRHGNIPRRFHDETDKIFCRNHGFRLLNRFSRMRESANEPENHCLRGLVDGGMAIAGALYLTLARASEQTAVAPVAPAAVPVVAGVVSRHARADLSERRRHRDRLQHRRRAQPDPGTDHQINFTEGQTVHAGDLLAQIDPRPYQAQIDQMTANRERDQAQLTNAHANLTATPSSATRAGPRRSCSRPRRRRSAQLQAADQGRPGADRRRQRSNSATRG